MTTYIFNIGFSKSGTTSLTKALNLLNIPSIHHNVDGRSLRKIVFKNFKNNKKLFDKLDTQYLGFSDFAGENFYKELYNQYPNSKFILTTRPFLGWFNSYIKMKQKIDKEEFESADLQKITYLNAIHRYYDTGSDIKNFFKSKPTQFLEMKICEGHGWNELCNFLQVDIPNIPFPWINETIEK